MASDGSAMKLNEIADNPVPPSCASASAAASARARARPAGAACKGQKARTGVRIKGFEGGQMPLYRRLPKRGFNNIFALSLQRSQSRSRADGDRQRQARRRKPVTVEALVSGRRHQSRAGRRAAARRRRTEGEGRVRGRMAPRSRRSAVVEKAGGSVKRSAAAEARSRRQGEKTRQPRQEADSKSGRGRNRRSAKRQN